MNAMSKIINDRMCRLARANYFWQRYTNKLQPSCFGQQSLYLSNESEKAQEKTKSKMQKSDNKQFFFPSDIKQLIYYVQFINKLLSIRQFDLSRIISCVYSGYFIMRQTQSISNNIITYKKNRFSDYLTLYGIFYLNLATLQLNKVILIINQTVLFFMSLKCTQKLIIV
ncbi:hypothetical protein ABPG74_014280 [Tetrahymena malaccensis]